MSGELEVQNEPASKVIHLNFVKPEVKSSPVTDELVKEWQDIQGKSSFKSEFDWAPIKDLEIRAEGIGIRGGFLFKSPLRFLGAHSTCQQCLYTFEIDTYGRGCVHNCVYCYAKAELTVHGMWNNPFPVPMNINDVHKIFYTAFETDRSSKWRDFLLKRIPLRIGSMSDSFMWMDKKYKVTQELLKILKHYKYPYVVFTRSDLVAEDNYIRLMDNKLASIQFSIASTNEELNRKIEPGAPSSERRLNAIKKLKAAGFWTTVRINPIFPIYPDGYFTDPSFNKSNTVPQFTYFDFDMVDEIANSGVDSILAGFGRFSSFSINRIMEATGVNLRAFYKDDERKSKRDFHFSDAEVRYYYEEIARRCKSKGVQFTTCYIGNGERHFWKDQDLWSNKKDCCNIKNRVPAFKTDSRSVSFDVRTRFISDKNATPVDSKQLHRPLDAEL